MQYSSDGGMYSFPFLRKDWLGGKSNYEKSRMTRVLKGT